MDITNVTADVTLIEEEAIMHPILLVFIIFFGLGVIGCMIQKINYVITAISCICKCLTCYICRKKS